MSQLRFFVPEWMVDRPLHVDLVGVGGTGADMLDALARMDSALSALGHPGLHVRVFDPDSVSRTNLLRQRFLPGDEGKNKAELLVQRYNLFMGTQYEAVARGYSARDTTQRGQPALLITCVDRAALRVEIGRYGANAARRSQILWLDTGNDAHSGQVVLGHLGQQPHVPLRLPNVLDLYPEMATQAKQLDNEGPSCSAEASLSRQEWPVNRQVAVSASTLLWNLLRHGSVDSHGTFIDVRTGLCTPLRIDPAIWEFMGYNSPVAATGT